MMTAEEHGADDESHDESHTGEEKKSGEPRSMGYSVVSRWAARASA